MNMRKIAIALMMLAASLLSGCFQVERVLTVKPDGSGVLEETFMMSKKTLAMMNEAFGDKKNGKEHDTGLFKEEQLKSAAARMGEGVSYMRGEKYATDDFEGYKAYYSVKDVNKLMIDSGPPKTDGKPEAVDPSKASRFVFIPGDTATLMIKSPKAKVPTKAEEKAEAAKPTTKAPETKPAVEPQKLPSQQDMEMMKQMFDGMRVAFSVKVEGQIVETNATHRLDDTVVLADIDFGKLLNMAPEELAKLNSIKEGDMTAAMAALKHLPGVKVDMNEEICIKFK